MRKRDLSRRRFLGQLTGGVTLPVLFGGGRFGQDAPSAPCNVRVLAAWESAASASACSEAGGHASPKPLLGLSDFSYVGAFRLPTVVSGQDATWGRGLACRYANRELRFFASTLSNTVYEVRCPSLAVNGPYAVAPVVRQWGDVSGPKRFTAQHGAASGRLYGLYWDPVDARLYWSYGNEYNAESADDPSVGCSILNEHTGSATPLGAWRFSGRGCKATMGGVLPIPEWFARTYCKGQRLGAGFGGYFSIVSTGPVHMGPSLCSFAPPDPARQADRSSLPFTPLVGYPFNSVAYSVPDRCHRDVDYRTEFDDWKPRNGVGYWSWSDWIWQGAVWIDLPEKHGVVYFPTLGNGRTWYEQSTLHAESASHWWYTYDPAALANVASGTRKEYEIQPARRWRVEYPGMSYPLPRWSDEPAHMVVGATFDSLARRLYLAVRFGAATGATPAACHLVHVYQIS